MKNLMLFIHNTWSGDVTYQEAIVSFTRKQLQEMETFLLEHPIYLDGIPENFISYRFKKDGEYEDGALLLQLLVNYID